MPKRLCPFDTFIAPQLKTYLGEKERVTKCTGGKAAMSEIHTKTLQKLYEGAKTSKQLAPCTCGHTTNQSTISRVSTNQSTAETLITNQNIDEDRMKQLRLGNHGELIRQSSEIKEVAESKVEICSFCDATMPCQQCQSICQQCHGLFCQNCCLNNFTGTEDTSLCLSCVK